MADPDITMSLNDTLELDTIIEKSTRATKPIGYDSNNFTATGIQTHTGVLKPENAGTHTININGQELTVKVTDPNNIPDSEDFEWASSELLSDRYTNPSGSFSQFSLQNDTTIKGDYLLEYSGSNTDTALIPINGTNYRLTEQGQPIFGADVIISSGNTPRPSILFGMNSKGDGYGARIDPDNSNAFGIVKFANGDISDTLVKGNVNPSYGTRYLPAIDWKEDNTISVTWYEYRNGSYSSVETISTTDSTYSSGTIGFYSNAPSVRWDNYRWNPSL